MDPAVAKVAIICACIFAVVLVAGLVLVAILAGDLVGLSLALGGTLTALGAFWAKVRSGSSTGS